MSLYMTHYKPSIVGMLGGLCELDPLDIRDSELLLKKLFQKYQMGGENVSELGAGIGRVSQHLFRKHFQKVFSLAYRNPTIENF